MNMIRYASPTVPNANDAKLPASYEAAKTALTNCASIDECQTWADKAAALASYAKQSKDEELMKMATRIRDRAIRRAGELLKQIEPATGKNNQYEQVKGGDAPTFHSRTEAAEAAGMSKHQQVQAIRVANVPQADFDRQVESDRPPTVTKLAEQGVKAAPRPVIDLKGRDPSEFNRSLHFVAEFEAYQRAIEKLDITTILPVLIESERARIRKAIAAIDAVHDRIITRI
jgi:hypothetical protein